MKKDAAQLLDEQVGDWEKSTQRMGWRVPPGQYLANLVGAQLDVTAKDQVMGVLLFNSVKPIEGMQLRKSHFLSFQSDRDGRNFGVDQLLTDVDLLRGYAGKSFLDRDEIRGGRAVEEVLMELAELRPKNVVLIVHPQEKTDSGKTIQNVDVGLPGSFGMIPAATPDGKGTASVEPASAKPLRKGGKVTFQGKRWEIVSLDAEASVATIKLGNKKKEVSVEELIPY